MTFGFSGNSQTLLWAKTMEDVSVKVISVILNNDVLLFKLNNNIILNTLWLAVVHEVEG